MLLLSWPTDNGGGGGGGGGGGTGHCVPGCGIMPKMKISVKAWCYIYICIGVKHGVIYICIGVKHGVIYICIGVKHGVIYIYV